MARAGINKVQVQQARDTVLARGENPSLDAIRIELGNTGSKTTIHRYLREIEEAESTRLDDEQLLTKTLQEMVARLAARLREEANELVSAAEKRLKDQEAQWKQERERLEGSLTVSGEKAHRLEQRLVDSRSSLEQATAELQSERLQAQRQAQQIADLEARLADKDSHLKSLEDKHQHARDALEHFRQASKEQRDQDIRRHEQQVQQLQTELRQLNQSIIVKQGEITQLNKDNARLASELGAVRRQAGSQEDALRKSEQLVSAQREQLSQTSTNLSAKAKERDLYCEQLERARLELKECAHRQTELEIALAEARTSLSHFNAAAEAKR
ncbi:DNA-binding protein [uncultured Microbulbifer sp.]|uniref:DNA-binding protein n=1 Tax=uncultured Microbulbifer sp. TaxID=348147 RepID=UPI0026052CF4|nr:DNA-binding protein [uncultured Microbulbifer sp.]